MELLISNDFRHCEWKMTQEMVKQIEKAKPAVSEPHFSPVPLLMYKGKVAGFDVYIRYSFKGTQLVKGNYLFRGIEDQDYSFKIESYFKIRAFFEEEYGKPIEESDPTKDKQTYIANENMKYSQAFDEKILILWARWHLPRTIIHLLIGGEATLNIDYYMK